MISPINTQQGHYEGVYGLDKSPAPVPGGYTDWKNIAIGVGFTLAISGTILYIQHQRMKEMNEQWRKQAKEASEKHLEAMKRHNHFVEVLATEFQQQRRENKLSLPLKQKEEFNFSETNKSNNHEG